MESGKYNRNKDMLDDYIGYKLTTENSSQHSSFNLKGIVVAVLIIIGMAMIYDALRPKCAHSGCDNTPEEGSCYCLIHDPKYYNNKNSYTSVFTTATTANLEVPVRKKWCKQRKFGFFCVKFQFSS